MNHHLHFIQNLIQNSARYGNDSAGEAAVESSTHSGPGSWFLVVGKPMAQATPRLLSLCRTEHKDACSSVITIVELAAIDWRAGQRARSGESVGYGGLSRGQVR
jgi:hypothetical protein